MTVRVSHREPHELCQVRVPKDSDFTVYNLPLGIFRTADRPPGAGMAIGQYIVDLRVLADSGLFHGLASKIHFESDSLNSLLSQGHAVTSAIRRKVTSLLTGELPGFALIRDQALVEQRTAVMLLPVTVADYTDFYSSEAHATNVGKLFRSAADALLPNWKHLPVAYHGRASSVVVSGTEIRRPQGQVWSEAAGAPEFTACRRLDYEVELGFVVGRDSRLGEPVPLAEAGDYVAGFLLVNDWSARDIQQWEYRPLGPFLGKSFATAVSPWLVLPDALEPYRVEGPRQQPELLPYLHESGRNHYDIALGASLHVREGFEAQLTATNSRYLYWSARQQLAHHTVNGCNVRVGDLMASGTISGEEPSSWGSLLELTYNGQRPVTLHPGITRTFVEDGDEVILTGRAGQGPYRVGFGELRNRILPALDYA